MNPHRLLLSCPDQPGIVAVVATKLSAMGANIVHADQHSTPNPDATFFFRVEFEGIDPSLVESEFAQIDGFNFSCRVISGEYRPKLAVFVSKEDHCLVDLIFQTRSSDIHADIAMVISNHDSLRGLVEKFDLPFHYLPISTETKRVVEENQQQLIAGADLVVLAKYMQILSPEFSKAWEGRIINIHHSFLPAFIGAKPYHQAYERGVKLIGATAHYVTSDLDMGPIIEQDVQRVDHRAEPAELRRLGRQVERAVLSRAVKWHTEDRVLIHKGRTVVFD